MKIVLFVEGTVEFKVLRTFFGDWLNEQLTHRVEVEPRNFGSNTVLWKDGPKAATDELKNPKRKDEIVAVISLLDLYECPGIPVKLKTTEERYAWAKQEIETKVDHAKFRQHFAVHETEAWLLSDAKNPSFSTEVRKLLESKDWQSRLKHPERINSTKPPATQLKDLYKKAHNGHGYDKIIHGAKLFRDLKAATAYEKCPHLKLMLDEMLQLAKDAGL